MSNILITSISKKVPLIKAVKSAALKLNTNVKIYGADSNSNIVGKYFVDDYWQMPHIKNLAPQLLISFCKQNNITAIIPTRDGELSFFADLRNELAKNGIAVMISDADSINVSIDKLKFYHHCVNSSISAVQTEKNIESIQSNKYVVKEQFGAGSLSMGLNLNAADGIAHAKKLQYPVYQPFINGNEFSIDVYVQKNKQVKGIIIRKRELVENGESQITYNVSNQQLKECCIAFAKSLNFYGHIVLQAIVDKQGNPWLIECNARFGGASTLSIQCGLDSFYWFLLESNGVDITSYPFIYDEERTYKQVRYMADKFTLEL